MEFQDIIQNQKRIITTENMLKQMSYESALTLEKNVIWLHSAIVQPKEIEANY